MLSNSKWYLIELTTCLFLMKETRAFFCLVSNLWFETLLLDKIIWMAIEVFALAIFENFEQSSVHWTRKITNTKQNTWPKTGGLKQCLTLWLSISIYSLHILCHFICFLMDAREFLKIHKLDHLRCATLTFCTQVLHWICTRIIQEVYFLMDINSDGHEMNS